MKNISDIIKPICAAVGILLAGFAASDAAAQASHEDCRTMDPQQPIYDSTDSSCSAATTDQDCIDAFPTSSVQDASGTTMLPLVLGDGGACIEGCARAGGLFLDTEDNRCRTAAGCANLALSPNPTDRQCSPPENDADCGRLFAWGTTLASNVGPIHDADASFTCRHPRQGECLAAYGFDQPIFDPSESDNCRPATSDADCASVFPGNRGIFSASADNNCRLPGASAECIRVDETEPVYDATEENNCRAAADDAECASEHASLPIRGDDGSCRLPANSAECLRADETEPVYDVAEDNNCKAATDDAECASEHANFPVRDDDGSCRLPADSDECLMRADLTQPVYDVAEDNNCRAAADDAECASEHANLPVRNDDGSCRLAANSAECLRVNLAQPVYDVVENNNCRAATNDAECASEHASLPIRGDDGSCRLPANSAECLRTDPTQPVYDLESSGNCRRVLADCRSDEIIVAGVCQCPQNQQEFNNDTPEIEEDDFCAVPVPACRPEQTHRPNRNICECPDGMQDFSGRCEAPVTCRPDQHRTANNTCACPEGEGDVDGQCAACRATYVIGRDNTCSCPDGFEEFDNGTPANDSDDFCAARLALTCRPTYEYDEGSNACVCSGSEQEFDNGTPANDSDDFCAVSAEPCPSSVHTYNPGTNSCDCPAGQDEFAERICHAPCPAGTQYLGSVNGCVSIEEICRRSNLVYSPTQGACQETTRLPAATAPSSQVVVVQESDDDDDNYAYIGAGILGLSYMIYAAGPTYSPHFNYSRENESPVWETGGRIEFQEGNFRTLVEASYGGEAGDGSYKTSTTHEGEYWRSSYWTRETKDLRAYGFSALGDFEHGPWSLTPAAEGQLNLDVEGDAWTSSTSLLLKAAWSNAKWEIRNSAGYSWSSDAGEAAPGVRVDFESRF